MEMELRTGHGVTTRISFGCHWRISTPHVLLDRFRVTAEYVLRCFVVATDV